MSRIAHNSSCHTSICVLYHCNRCSYFSHHSHRFCISIASWGYRHKQSRCNTGTMIMDIGLKGKWADQTNVNGINPVRTTFNEQFHVILLVITYGYDTSKDHSIHCTGSTAECRTTVRAIDPAPVACIHAKLHFIIIFPHNELIWWVLSSIRKESDTC